MDSGLLAEGWQWRCFADATRIREIVETYENLGLEVRIEQMVLDGLKEDCSGCRDSLMTSSSVFVREKRR
jgi:hypothetical protein